MSRPSASPRLGGDCWSRGQGQLAKETDWVACRPFGHLRFGCRHLDFAQGRRQSALALMAAEGCGLQNSESTLLLPGAARAGAEVPSAFISPGLRPKADECSRSGVMHFAKTPIKKYEGQLLGGYRYGALLRFSLDRDFVDGPLWSHLACLPCYPYPPWWGWSWFRSCLTSVPADWRARAPSSVPRLFGYGAFQRLVSWLLRLGRAFAGSRPAPGGELAGVRDPPSTVLHPDPSASVMSRVSLGSGSGSGPCHWPTA